MTRVAKHFKCPTCQATTTVYVDETKDWKGVVTGECSNKHTRKQMQEVEEEEE